MHGTEADVVTQEILDIISHISPAGSGTGQVRGHSCLGRTNQSGAGTLRVYRELLAFDVVLYEYNNDTCYTHRLSADCSFLCHITLIDCREMITGYLEKHSVILL